MSALGACLNIINRLPSFSSMIYPTINDMKNQLKTYGNTKVLYNLKIISAFDIIKISGYKIKTFATIFLESLATGYIG